MALDVREQLEPVHARHTHVTDDDVDRLAVKDAPGGERVGGLEDFEALLGQLDLKRNSLQRLVVDNQYPARHFTSRVYGGDRGTTPVTRLRILHSYRKVSRESIRHDS